MLGRSLSLHCTNCTTHARLTTSLSREPPGTARVPTAHSVAMMLAAHRADRPRGHARRDPAP